MAYYTRLEQGHSRHASDEVLLALARALQLSVTEAEHLLDLGRGTPPLVPADDQPEQVSAGALRLLALVDERPAVILGRRNDVLAWNAELTRLVGELCVGDDAFAALWSQGRVGECVAGTKRMTHPAVGEVTVDFQLWAQADRPEQRLEVYELRGDDDGSRTRALLGSLLPVDR